MIGAIAGDTIGSTREFMRVPLKTKDFELFEKDSTFTDDSVMTCAVAYAILHESDYETALHTIGRKYLDADVGFGGNFFQWLLKLKDYEPYGSYGNGSAMRVSPVAWAFDTEEEVLKQAKLTALPTHNHLEGIKGAQAQ